MAGRNDLVYWEKQGSDRMCALHCINCILQGPVYSEVEMVSIGTELDKKEKQLLTDPNEICGTLLDGGSGNVASDGYFNISVLIECLKRKNINIFPSTHPGENFHIETAGVDYEAFICNHNQHWFAIRKIHDQWWNLDSIKSCPRNLSIFSLSLLLESLINEGYSIFIVRCTVGQLPSPHPQMMKNLNQFYLKPEHIQNMEMEAKSKENIDAKKAERIADNPNDGGQSFLAKAPRDLTEHEWPSTGGYRLDGTENVSINNDDEFDDPELKEALRMSIQTFKQEMKVKEPSPQPSPDQDAFTIRVRLPGKNICRRFTVDAKIRSIFDWLEFETSQDDELSKTLPPLSTMNSYSLVQTFLRRRIQKQNLKIFLIEQSETPVCVSDLALDVLNLQKQEQFDLQLS